MHVTPHEMRNTRSVDHGNKPSHRGNKASINAPMLVASIHDSDQGSRGCQPSGAVVRIAAIKPEKPASATPICAIAIRTSPMGEAAKGADIAPGRPSLFQF